MKKLIIKLKKIPYQKKNIKNLKKCPIMSKKDTLSKKTSSRI